tara:strand:+ start:839 stop:1279 length:441 start_codon:yes stop_codon:yes gene_type:complete
MRVIETKVYTIEEHPNKSLCYQWIRDNWHDLNRHSVGEVIDSLKALQNEIGGDLDYSISSVPDRGEFIRFTDYDTQALISCSKVADELPLTGVCWDYHVIKGMRYGEPTQVLDTLHADTNYQYSDEGLYELCEANQYEFTEEGNIN